MNLPHVLVFLEDPGAASFITPVLPRMREAGFRVTVCACGEAAPQLMRAGEIFQPLDEAAALSVLMQKMVTALLVGTSENPATKAFELVAAARHAGVVSVGIVDGAANAEWRFRGHGDSPLYNAPDWIVVADKPTQATFVVLGHPSTRVVCTGHPALERVGILRRRLDEMDFPMLRSAIFPNAGKRRVLIFVAEISEGLNPEQYRRSSEYTLQGRGGSDKRTDVVLEEVLDAIDCLEFRPYVVLRLHPKNVPADFDRYLDEVDQISSGGDPLEMVYAADAVVGMTSRLLSDAAALGVPTLSIVPRQSERSWLVPENGLEIPCVAEKERIVPALNSLLVQHRISISSSELSATEKMVRLLRFLTAPEKVA